MNLNYPKQLQIVKVLMLFFGLGALVVGTTTLFYPLISWPMYSTYNPDSPGSSYSLIRLRVFDNINESYVLSIPDLLTMGKYDAGERIINESIQKDASLSNSEIRNRKALIKLVQSRMPDIKIDRIEIVEAEWQVSPMSLPPLDRLKPVQEVPIDTIRVSEDI